MTNLVSPLHPHEPEQAPILDPEGRCLVCGVQWRDQIIAGLTADRDKLRALISVAIPGDDCPWCKLGFEPCVCEAEWVEPLEEARARFDWPKQDGP